MNDTAVVSGQAAASGPQVRHKSKGSSVKSLGVGLNFILFPLIILGAWEYATRTGKVNPAILPSIEEVAATFFRLIQNGQLPHDLGVSLGRVVTGYSIAIVAGILFGVIMGMSVKASRFFTIIFDGIRQVPPIAWIPLVILWFGIGETSKLVIIVKSSFFPILLNTIAGVKGTPTDYLEVARLYKLSKWETFRKVYLPFAIPSIFVGLRLGLGVAWMSVVAAELIAASSGIGFRINDARMLMLPDVIMVGIIAVGAIGVTMDRGLSWICRRVTPWSASR
ncbi:MAG: ABC-type transporter, integral rane subunit [Paenibacillaceae bacterium]|jgi:sulfonate transport system permease protein|nr:ABC-type transporter, integral rane subunit [Paenibacillaceae bacterium]